MSFNAYMNACAHVKYVIQSQTIHCIFTHVLLVNTYGRGAGSANNVAGVGMKTKPAPFYETQRFAHLHLSIARLRGLALPSLATLPGSVAR